MASLENNQIKNPQIIQALMSLISRARSDQTSMHSTPIVSQESQLLGNFDPRLQSLLYLLSLQPPSQAVYTQLLGLSNAMMMAPQRMAQLMALQGLLQNSQVNANNLYYLSSINQVNNINLNLTNCAHKIVGNPINESKTTSASASVTQTNPPRDAIKKEKPLEPAFDSSLFSDISEIEFQEKYPKKENLVKGILYLYFYLSKYKKRFSRKRNARGVSRRTRSSK
jgi:hypothetical protein